MKLLGSIFCLVLLVSCNQDTNKTREEAARAAAQIKQESKEAGKEIKKGAEEARRQGTAVAEGVRQGWNSNAEVDVNSASKDQLKNLPGVDDATADRIISGRPYGAKSDLVKKRIISQAEFDKIQGQVTAR